MKRMLLAAAVVAAGTVASPVLADIKVGVVVCATGPAASLGIPEKNTVELLPTDMAGQKVSYIVLDDGTDPTTAVKDVRKLISEDKVDIVIGSTTTPTSLAMREALIEAETAMISMAGNALVVDPADPKTKWVFKSAQNDELMATAISANMKVAGIKKVGYIGFADPYGEGWYAEFSKAAKASGIELVGNERYARLDQNVTGQIARLLSAKPEAVLIGAAGTPGALPQTELAKRGYKGKVYQTHGVANQDFLKIGGKDVEGTILPAGPMLVYEQLPDSNPVKASAATYVSQYEAKFGPRSTFGGHAWDATQLIAHAVPAALSKGQPGTPEFRRALRDGLEQSKDVKGAHGVFNMSPKDHGGLDERARVMVTISGGKWKLIQ